MKRSLLNNILYYIIWQLVLEIWEYSHTQIVSESMEWGRWLRVR